MVNHTTSGCKNCMVLMRILVINNLVHNRCIVVKYIKTKENSAADALSRGRIHDFKKDVKIAVNDKSDKIPEFLWPPTKIWLD